MQFKKFDPATATGMDCVAVVGQRSVGKTVLVQELLPHFKCSETVVISPTESCNSEYAGLVSRKNIRHEYEEEFVTNIAKPGCIVFENCLYLSLTAVHIRPDGRRTKRCYHSNYDYVSSSGCGPLWPCM